MTQSPKDETSCCPQAVLAFLVLGKGRAVGTCSGSDSGLKTRTSLTLLRIEVCVGVGVGGMTRQVSPIPSVQGTLSLREQGEGGND